MESIRWTLIALHKSQIGSRIFQEPVCILFSNNNPKIFQDSTRNDKAPTIPQTTINECVSELMIGAYTASGVSKLLNGCVSFMFEIDLLKVIDSVCITFNKPI